MIEKLFAHSETSGLTSYRELIKHIECFAEPVNQDDLEEEFVKTKQGKDETVKAYAEKLNGLALKIIELMAQKDQKRRKEGEKATKM